MSYIPKKVRQILTLSVDGFLRRIAVLLGVIATGILCFTVYLIAKEQVHRHGRDAAAGWLWLFFSPIWLGLSVVAVFSGNRLGGVWRVIGWSPLLLGGLVNLLLLIDSYFVHLFF